MIIIRLEISNYKQFAGDHVIDFPANGVVAIIGQNGAGKTTLFEAIEWALYGPPGIRNADTRPRLGTGGAPRVCVTLQTRDGRFYQVERFFRGKGMTAQATIYEVDAIGDIQNTVVSGPKAVTEWVTSKLVGLSHPAFISTFFTRQKELSFFGTQKDTDRRRLVSRLLGQETIRDAQTLVAEDRRKEQDKARALRSQHERESDGRDFVAEGVALQAALDEAEGQRREAEHCVAVRLRELDEAREAEAAWLELERRHSGIQQQVTVAAGKVSAARGTIEQLDRQLAWLAERDAERARLVPISERAPHLRREVERWQRERECAETADRLRREIAALDTTVAHRIAQVRTLICTVPDVDGWRWAPGDERDPAAATGRLADVAAAIDVGAARAYTDGVAQASEHSRQDRDARDHAGRCEETLAHCRARLDEALRAGDPEAEERDAERDRVTAAEERAAANAEAASLRAEVAKLRGSIQQLRDQGTGTCPTCGQPIDDVVIMTIESGIRDRETTIGQRRAIAEAAARRGRDAEARRDAARSRRTAIGELRQRIQLGEVKTHEALDRRDAAGQLLRESLAALGLTETPSAETVAAARARLSRLEAVHRQAGTLNEIATRFRDDAARRGDLVEQLGQLGETAYDAAAHRAASDAYDQAREARGRIEAITGELAQRDRLMTDRQATSDQLAALVADQQRLERALAEVGFDPEALSAARQRVRDANEQHIAAINERNDRTAATRDIARQQEALAREEERLAQVAEMAALAEREYDQLDRMYKGFDEFEKWVAQHINPILSEQASSILTEITAGRYDRVEFDDSYALRVYDGDESFPVSQFSGGERDVASLAARLALSRVIGAQAAQPPAFVVLDEVFGSLDQDRRSRLMSMLETLTNDDTDGFRQLFVISHVDDVRLSQSFDDIWKISEDAQGISHWSSQKSTGVLEDF